MCRQPVRGPPRTRRPRLLVNTTLQEEVNEGSLYFRLSTLNCAELLGWSGHNNASGRVIIMCVEIRLIIIASVSDNILNFRLFMSDCDINVNNFLTCYNMNII